MAKRKPPSGQRLKEIRAGLAVLKRKGLYSGDVRNAKGGWRQKSLLKEYADVIAGKAVSIKVGRRDAKDFDKSYKAKGDRIVLKAKKGEVPRYNKKTKRLEIVVEEYGVKYKRIYLKTRPLSPQDLPNKPPKGKKWLYKLPHNPLYDHDGMIAVLTKYQDKKGVLDAMQIYEMDLNEFPDEYGDDL